MSFSAAQFEAAKAQNPNVVGYWSEVGWMDKDQNPIAIDEDRLKTDALALTVGSEGTMEQLRMMRDSKLKECEWRMTVDYPYADQDAWKTYRQALRELPQQIEAGTVPKPSLTEFDELVFDHWPSEPSA